MYRIVFFRPINNKFEEFRYAAYYTLEEAKDTAERHANHGFWVKEKCGWVFIPARSIFEVRIEEKIMYKFVYDIRWSQTDSDTVLVYANSKEEAEKKIASRCNGYAYLQYIRQINKEFS